MKIRDRIKELRRVRAADLMPHPKNWRRHPKAQGDALRGLLAEIGYADALLARELPDGELQLIDGHLRAETTPNTLVPVLVLDVSEEEAEKLLLTLDPLAAMAESDAERIKALLATVRTDDQAVQDLLKRLAGPELEEMLHPEELEEAAVSPERADELQAKWGTALGQLWQIGPHLLVCGDCTSKPVIRRLFGDGHLPISLIWTDPPYGVDYASKTAWVGEHGGGQGRRAMENDSLGPAKLQKLLAAALASILPCAARGAVIYASVPSMYIKHFIQGLEDGGFTYHHCLIWVKQSHVLGRADYHYRHEPILYGWLENGPHYFVDDRTQDSIFEIDRPQISELHPTTKPVELIARMLANSSRPGEVVYDPFCGGGSTLLAAHQLGRIGFGCEIDPGYVAVTLERLSLLGMNPQRVH